MRRHGWIFGALVLLFVGRVTHEAEVVEAVEMDAPEVTRSVRQIASDPPLEQAPPPSILERATPGEPEPSGLATVSGVVRDADGRPSEGAVVMVEGFAGDVVAAAVDGAGRFRVAVPAGPLRVVAQRLDGMLESESASLRGRLEPGAVWDVELELPVDFAGETGVLATMEVEGFRVAGVVPGSPAAELGLRRGDRVVSVDGRASSSLSQRDFDGLMRGPEGSSVNVVVEAEDDDGRFELELELPRRAQEDVRVFDALEG